VSSHVIGVRGDRHTNLPAAARLSRQNASFVKATSGALVKRRNKRSVWDVLTDPYRGAHFATMPRKLVEPCILSSCPPGGVVLDPFVGSGTVGLVAAKHGRNWIGFDLSAPYKIMATKRTAQQWLFGAKTETAARRRKKTAT
jgi:DNA modification methylase